MRLNLCDLYCPHGTSISCADLESKMLFASRKKWTIQVTIQVIKAMLIQGISQF